jgi:hypothetical protein
MHASTRFALHFAIGACVIVAVGTLFSELSSDPAQQHFALPPFGVTAAVFSIGTFIWSYLVAAGSAWSIHDIGTVPPLAGYVGGAIFALLTPALGFALWNLEFPLFAVLMLAWVVLFPVVFTLGTARWARSNKSLERTREG